ncbi:Ku protein [Streptomyces sp. NPDC093064]|uniref:Ku protein n=1 Tax=Streptomyces sp. NPDC093064 TaxID=3366020 RepID=UPI00382A9F70
MQRHGLVSVPITVLSATEDHSVHFRRIHTADNALVRNRYWCEAEDREVTFGEIGRGYELPSGRVIPVTDEELRALPLPAARAIELIAFIPASAVDPLRIGPGYYLQPQGAVAAKPYLVLRHALKRASRVALAPRSRRCASSTPGSRPSNAPTSPADPRCSWCKAPRCTVLSAPPAQGRAGWIPRQPWVKTPVAWRPVVGVEASHAWDASSRASMLDPQITDRRALNFSSLHW